MRLFYAVMMFAVLSFSWIIWELWHSPKGYENETGFHKHEDEKKD